MISKDQDLYRKVDWVSCGLEDIISFYPFPNIYNKTVYKVWNALYLVNSEILIAVWFPRAFTLTVNIYNFLIPWFLSGNPWCVMVTG